MCEEVWSSFSCIIGFCLMAWMKTGGSRWERWAYLHRVGVRAFQAYLWAAGGWVYGSVFGLLSTIFLLSGLPRRWISSLAGRPIYYLASYYRIVTTFFNYGSNVTAAMYVNQYRSAPCSS